MTKAEENNAAAGDDHRNNRHHFNQRQPELHLAENAHVAQVHRADEEDNTQYPNPARHIRVPEPHIDTKRGDIRQGDNHHLKGIGPAGNKPGQRPEILAGIAAEGAGNGVAYRHFAQRTHDDKYRRAADQIGQQNRRSRGLNGGGRTIKQPGTNGGTERDEANMSGIQPAQQVGLLWRLWLLLHMQVS